MRRRRPRTPTSETAARRSADGTARAQEYPAGGEPRVYAIPLPRPGLRPVAGSLTQPQDRPRRRAWARDRRARESRDRVWDGLTVVTQVCGSVRGIAPRVRPVEAKCGKSTREGD